MESRWVRRKVRVDLRALEYPAPNEISAVRAECPMITIGWKKVQPGLRQDILPCSHELLVQADSDWELLGISE